MHQICFTSPVNLHIPEESAVPVLGHLYKAIVVVVYSHFFVSLLYVWPAEHAAVQFAVYDLFPVLPFAIVTDLFVSPVNPVPDQPLNV